MIHHKHTQHLAPIATSTASVACWMRIYVTTERSAGDVHSPQWCSLEAREWSSAT